MKCYLLLKEQQTIVDALIGIYNKNKINDYGNFKEYQKEFQILNGYEDIVNKIEFAIEQHQSLKMV